MRTSTNSKVRILRINRQTFNKVMIVFELQMALQTIPALTYATPPKRMC